MFSHEEEKKYRHLKKILIDTVRSTPTFEEISLPFEARETLLHAVIPAQVGALVNKIRQSGINSFLLKSAGEERTLNTDLAIEMAAAARNALFVVTYVLASNSMFPVEANNDGSTTIGIVSPDSDIDLSFVFPKIIPLSPAREFIDGVEGLLRSDETKTHLHDNLAPWYPLHIQIKMEGYNPGQLAGHGGLGRLLTIS